MAAVDWCTRPRALFSIENLSLVLQISGGKTPTSMPHKKRHNKRKPIPAYKLTVRGKQQKYVDPADMAAITIMLGRQLRQEADDQDLDKSVRGDSEDSVETMPL